MRALFIRDLCAALERVHTMTPIATNRTATQTAPNTTDMVLMSVIISSLEESADSMARLKVLRIGRNSRDITNNYLSYKLVHGLLTDLKSWS